MVNKIILQLALNFHTLGSCKTILSEEIYIVFHPHPLEQHTLRNNKLNKQYNTA